MVTYASPTSVAQATSLAGLGVARVETYQGPGDPYTLRTVPSGELLVFGRTYWIQRPASGTADWTQG
jgi:hypothetical protein